MERERLWTLPNVVSLSRVGLAAAFALTDSVVWRLGLVGVASTSDVLDGWLARRRAGPSRWGNLIDPVSDRAFAVTAVCTLIGEQLMSPLQAFVFLSRDLATLSGFGAVRILPGLRARLRGVRFVARFPGKIVTVLQFLALVAFIAAPQHVTVLMIVLGVASLVAIADYTWALLRAGVP